MCLALCLGDLHEVAVRKARLLEHGTGNLDVVVLGKGADDTSRRIRNRRDATRQFRQSLRLDLLDQTANDVVEQRHMRGIETGYAVEEQGGDAAECLRAFFGRAMLNDVFQFRKERCGNTHTRPAKRREIARGPGFYTNLRADSEGRVSR